MAPALRFQTVAETQSSRSHGSAEAYENSTMTVPSKKALFRAAVWLLLFFRHGQLFLACRHHSHHHHRHCRLEIDCTDHRRCNSSSLRRFLPRLLHLHCQLHKFCAFFLRIVVVLLSVLPSSLCPSFLFGTCFCVFFGNFLCVFLVLTPFVVVVAVSHSRCCLA